MRFCSALVVIRSFSALLSDIADLTEFLSIFNHSRSLFAGSAHNVGYFPVPFDCKKPEFMPFSHMRFMYKALGKLAF